MPRWWDRGTESHSSNVPPQFGNHFKVTLYPPHFWRQSKGEARSPRRFYQSAGCQELAAECARAGYALLSRRAGMGCAKPQSTPDSAQELLWAAQEETTLGQASTRRAGFMSQVFSDSFRIFRKSDLIEFSGGYFFAKGGGRWICVPGPTRGEGLWRLVLPFAWQNLLLIVYTNAFRKTGRHKHNCVHASVCRDLSRSNCSSTPTGR